MQQWEYGDSNQVTEILAYSCPVEPLARTPLVLQPVAADGVTFTGAETIILDHDGLADGGVVENPSLVKVDSTYVLFFSPGCFNTSNCKSLACIYPVGARDWMSS